MASNPHKPAMGPTCAHPGTCHTEITVEMGFGGRGRKRRGKITTVGAPTTNRSTKYTPWLNLLQCVL